jgi:NAD(P)-dependent dehydrogenase (short-subunit alcohol dehydrogenase family)
MARVFITGSADGLGLELAADGHEVVLHGRSPERAAQAQGAVPGAVDALPGDLASVAETRELAARARQLGPYDAVVHNAGLGYRERHTVTADGVEHVFAVNVLAPYVLTALVPARRLLYLSSGLHQRGNPRLDDLAWETRRWNPMQAYCDSKLLDTALAFAVAQRWPEVIAAAVEPGWIATKMGGSGAPGTLAEGVDTQRWLATSDDAAADTSGRLLHERRVQEPSPLAQDAGLQGQLIEVCAQVSGVDLPASPPAAD